MSRQNLIERALEQLEGGAFQKLAEAYVYRKLGLKSITALGSQSGTNKPTKGVPDAHSLTGRDAILIAFTTAQHGSFGKLEKDIKDCISSQVPNGYTKRIVCCHLVWRLTPKQEGRLRALDSRLELIGPKTIALDLSNKYHDLAADYLHVRMGVDAIITPDEWIRREEKKGYATPQSGELRHRTKELEELRDALERVQIVVIHGPSGCGKTRLALELVNRYAQDKRVASYVLSKVRGAGVAEDVNEFLSEGDAVLLVDDAQQSDGLDELLEVALKNEDLRTVLTVRDYARKSLLTALRCSAKFEKYPLQPLDNQAVEELMRDNFGIINHYLLEKIGKVARGNLRLAIMAALCAERDGYSGIESAHAVMDLFYKGLIDELDQDDLMLLSYLSVYSPCDFREGDPAYESLLAEGMLLSEMKRRARKLHDRNILDVIESPERVVAVKFEQLNLQDYCTYKAIFEEHIINLYEFISMFVLSDRQRVVRVLNVLISIFGDDETISKIKSDCKRVWMNSGSYSITERCEIMDVLHPLIPDDAYCFACNEIRGMPSSYVPISEQGDYGRQATGEIPVSLAILCELMDSKHYPDAISVLLDGIQKGCFKIGDYKSVIEGSLVITMHSAETGFLRERRFLDELRRRMNKESDSRNLQFFGLKLCEQYLAFSHVSTEAEEGGAIRFLTIRMPETEDALELRSSAIAFLCSLLELSNYQSDAARVLCPHVGIVEKEPVKEDVRFFLESGIRSFVSHIPAGFVPTSREELELVYHCSLACEALSLQEQETMSSLLPLAYSDREKLMESFNPDEGEILSAVEGWSSQRYEDVLKINQEMWGKGELDPYSAGSLVDRVFIALLSEDRPDISPEGIFYYFCNLHNADQQISLGSRIIERLGQRIGWRLLLDTAISHGLATLAVAGIEMAPADVASNNDIDFLLLMAESEQVLMRIDGVMGIESKTSGFASRYCRTVKSSLLKKPGYAHLFFLPLSNSREPMADLEVCFGADLNDLLEIYADNIHDRHFDYSGLVFRYLDERGADPIERLFQLLVAADNYASRRVIICRLGQASRLSNPMKRMREVVRRLAGVAKYPTGDVYALLVHNDYLAAGFDVPTLVFEELRIGLEKGNIPNYFSRVLSDTPFMSRVEPYVALLSSDSAGKLFDVLPFGSSSYAGSIEQGFAPAIRTEIEIIETISDLLPHDGRFRYHREVLSDIICRKEREIDEERWRSFHETL